AFLRAGFTESANASGAITTPQAQLPSQPLTQLPTPEVESLELDLRRLTRELLAGNSMEIYREVQDAVDQIVLDEVLKHVDGNQVQACKRLGIARMTLRNKLPALEH